MVLLETYYNNIERVRALYPNARFISVSRFLPKDKEKNAYNPCEERDLILAPSIKLFKAYKDKNNGISWPEYILQFKEEMSNDEAQGAMWVIAQRATAKDICLVCFEGPEEGEHCHRYLLLDMITNIAKNNNIPLQVIKTTNFHINGNHKKSVELFNF